MGVKLNRINPEGIAVTFVRVTPSNTVIGMIWRYDHSRISVARRPLGFQALGLKMSATCAWVMKKNRGESCVTTRNSLYGHIDFPCPVRQYGEISLHAVWTLSFVMSSTRRVFYQIYSARLHEVL